MKRTSLLLVLLLLLLLSSLAVSGQGGIIARPTATPISDTDGDGLPDTRDQCPTEAGPLSNNGCPLTFVTPDSPPNDPPNSPPDNPNVGQPVDRPTSVPTPFAPPALPPNGCYVTPRPDSRINVRSAPKLDAPVIGSLLPGTIYEALGFVANGTEMWMRLTQYQGSDGTLGYAAKSVLMTSPSCPEIELDATFGDQTGAADDLSSNPPTEVTLCYLSVGYDPAYWGSDFDAQLGDEPVVYGAFYFEREPGLPILEGTPIWGVVYLNGYNELPPDSPLFFQDPDHAVAVARDQSVIDAAINGGLSTAFDAAYPAPNGGVRAANGTTFYRLSDAAHVGNCGPIIAIDDFVRAPAGVSVVVDPCPVQPLGVGMMVIFSGGSAARQIPEDYDVLNCQTHPDDLLGVVIPQRDSALVHPTNPIDCNGNGVPDYVDFPVPSCAYDLTVGDTGDPVADDVDWWAKWLPLICGEGNPWYVMFDLDEDGNRVVLDAGCTYEG